MDARALAQLFSASGVRALAESNERRTLRELLRETALTTHVPPDATISAVYDAAFATLNRPDNRTEYIFKSALIHRIVLGRHSLRTATISAEFRVGGTMADAAIFNGAASAYEIKTDKDDLTKLPKQIFDYRKFFPFVSVLVGRKHTEQVLDTTPASVGVFELSRRQNLTVVRRPQADFSQLSGSEMLSSITKREALLVLRELNLKAPNVPNTLLHSELNKLFGAQPPTTLIEAIRKTLLRTRSSLRLEQDIGKLPHSLQPAAITMKFSTNKLQGLIRNTQIKMSDLLAAPGD